MAGRKNRAGCFCDYCNEYLYREVSDINEGKNFCSIAHRNLYHQSRKYSVDLILQSYESHCLFCNTVFIRGYKGGWCQPACYRLNQVTTRAAFMKRKEPDRWSLEGVYGNATPEWQGW